MSGWRRPREDRGSGMLASRQASEQVRRLGFLERTGIAQRVKTRRDRG
jgi:hypothetical protein